MLSTVRTSVARSILVLALLGAASGVAIAQPGAVAGAGGVIQPPPPRITVTGTASIDRAPDQAVVSVGVVATGKTSQEATEKLNRTMTAVTDAVKATSLADLVVQTQGLSLQPRYKQQQMNGGMIEEQPQIIGYTAMISLSARTSDVKNVGKIIDAALGAGANTLNGVSFVLKDDAEAKRQALSAAAIDARSKAQAVATALDLKIVSVLEVNTDGAIVRPFYQQFGGAESAPMMAMRSTATPIESGDVGVSATVTIVFQIGK